MVNFSVAYVNSRYNNDGVSQTLDSAHTTLYIFLKVFRLLSGNEERYLAPGLKLPVVVVYSPQDAGTHKGSLEIYVDGALEQTVPILA